MFTLILVLSGIVAFLIAGGIAAVTRRLTGKDTLAVVLGTITMPALILAGLAYWNVTLEVDDAPPGMVILGNLALVAVIVPVALLASYSTVRLLARRDLRNGS